MPQIVLLCLCACACMLIWRVVLSKMASRSRMTTKSDVSERRRFVPAWKMEFPWLFLDGQAGVMLCRYCVDAHKRNAFTTGCSQFKKDSVRKHALTADHRAALQDRRGRRDMERAVARAHRSQETSVIAAMKTVYFMAKKNLANDIFGDMKQFLIHQISLTCGTSVSECNYSEMQCGTDSEICTVPAGKHCHRGAYLREQQRRSSDHL